MSKEKNAVAIIEPREITVVERDAAVKQTRELSGWFQGGMTLGIFGGAALAVTGGTELGIAGLLTGIMVGAVTIGRTIYSECRRDKAAHKLIEQYKEQQKRKAADEDHRRELAHQMDLERREAKAAQLKDWAIAVLTPLAEKNALEVGRPLTADDPTTEGRTLILRVTEITNPLDLKTGDSRRRITARLHIPTENTEIAASPEVPDVGAIIFHIAIPAPLCDLPYVASAQPGPVRPLGPLAPLSISPVRTP